MISVMTVFVCFSAGIDQSDDMKRFLWYAHRLSSSVLILMECRNNHFAAVASDQPALEVIFIFYLCQDLSYNNTVLALARTPWDALLA